MITSMTPNRSSFLMTTGAALLTLLAPIAKSAPGSTPETSAPTTNKKASTPARAAQPTGVAEPTVVLVHGAWADGSSWSKVIPLLQARGIHVVAVQNPLSSLADDVAATNHAIDQQSGPVVLVGHSWGGVVISQAGNNSKVSALVYVAAFAPDSGQSANDLLKGLPTPPYVAGISKDEAGFLKLSSEAVSNYFAPDLSTKEKQLLAVTQGPFFAGCLDDKVTHAAWRDKPSYWALSEKDQIIDPRLQAMMSGNLKATVTKVPTSHVAMLADPKGVAEVIFAAIDKVR